MNAKYDNIRILLQRFYQGETSLSEEKALSAFFLSATDLPEDMEADRKLFQALASAETFATPPADLDSKIMEAIEKTSHDRDVEKLKLIKGNILSRNWIRRVIAFSAVAAVLILVLLPIRHHIFQAETQPQVKTAQANDKISEEELQALETSLLALDKAAQKLAYAYECIEESDSKVTNACRNIDKMLDN